MPVELQESALESPQPEIDSYEQWESSQKEQPAPAQPVEEEKQPSAPKGQTAADPESALPQEQKKQQPKRKHDAESRISDLTRDNADLKRQLEDLRKNREAPSQATQPVPEAKKAPEPAKLPKLAEYVRDQAKLRPSATQEDLIEEFYDLKFAERDRLREERATKEKQEAESRAASERWSKTLDDARKKYPDIDPGDVFGRTNDPNSGIILHPQVFKPLQDSFPNWVDVLYHLADSQEDYARVKAIANPQLQFLEVGMIARQLANPPKSAESVQEQPQKVRPISRVPAPQKHTLGGGMPASGKSMRDAGSFEEAEHLEKQRLAGGR